MTTPDVEGLLRELAPQALGALARRYGDFPDAEDAVQEALVSAAAQWPAGLPDQPLSWLITVASRRLVDSYRSTDARRRREALAASLSIHREAVVPSSDDSLVLAFLCCDDALTPTLSIPLTLRAVAGLTTREIAAAYLVPESTMAQRISRAKAKLRGRRFELPADPAARLPSLHRAFRGAGLPTPQLRLDTVVGGGADAPWLLLVNIIHTGMPILERLGVAATVDPATLGQRLVTETEAADGIVVCPLVIHAWCRTADPH